MDIPIRNTRGKQRKLLPLLWGEDWRRCGMSFIIGLFLGSGFGFLVGAVLMAERDDERR